MVGFEYSFFKIGVLYLQWTKRTGKQKHPSRRVHFLLQKNTGNDERQIMTSKEVVSLALYFYGAQAEQYASVEIPKELLTGKDYSSLSASAKML